MIGQATAISGLSRFAFLSASTIADVSAAGTASAVAG
jgi:hypothetical protein